MAWIDVWVKVLVGLVQHEFWEETQSLGMGSDDTSSTEVLPLFAHASATRLEVTHAAVQLISHARTQDFSSLH